MNRYPLWKYIVILVALAIGFLYTLPNFFGEAPIYTENASDSIMFAFQTLKGELVKRTEMIIAERPSLQRKFRKGIAELEEALHGF